MSHERYAPLLNDFVDGSVEPSLRAEVEAHVQECAACRTEVDALRELVEAAARLPRSIQPRRDLWPGVERRLVRRAPGHRPRWALRSAVAAAAVLVIALSLTQVRSKSGREADAGPSDRGSTIELAVVSREWMRTESAYVAAAAELQEAVDATREALDPATVALIEANLRIIDEAIRESRAALAVDPGNRELMRLLASTHEKKLDLLQQTTRLARM